MKRNLYIFAISLAIIFHIFMYRAKRQETNIEFCSSKPRSPLHSATHPNRKKERKEVHKKEIYVRLFLFLISRLEIL